MNQNPEYRSIQGIESQEGGQIQEKEQAWQCCTVGI